MLRDIIQIGKVVKPDGIKGNISLDVNVMYEKSLLKAGFLFIYIDGLPVPFRIEEKKSERGLLVRLEEVNSPEKAGKFTGLPVGLHKKDILYIKKSLLAEKDQWKNYTLYDHGQVVGIIEEVSLFPGQLMALVKKEKGQVIHIPVVEEWIISADDREKIIQMSLPEGLVETLG
jgi:16S rRNA processing protein RimM